MIITNSISCRSPCHGTELYSCVQRYSCITHWNISERHPSSLSSSLQEEYIRNKGNEADRKKRRANGRGNWSSFITCKYKKRQNKKKMIRKKLIWIQEGMRRELFMVLWPPLYIHGKYLFSWSCPSFEHRMLIHETKEELMYEYLMYKNSEQGLWLPMYFSRQDVLSLQSANSSLVSLSSSGQTHTKVKTHTVSALKLIHKQIRIVLQAGRIKIEDKTQDKN